MKFNANGKLLLSGEYLVMEGAEALALPVVVGQDLIVKTNNSNKLTWIATIPSGSWFNASYDLKNLDVIEADNSKLANDLQNILKETLKLSPDFLASHNGFIVETNCDFNPEYGFGTSSTLISNISSWADADPYKLLDVTFGGSGYDIACAKSNGPLVFQRKNNQIKIKKAKFDPAFKDMLYFVYLGKKQNSKKSITHFAADAKYNASDILTVSDITHNMLIASNIEDFEKLLIEHEHIMSTILKMPTVKNEVFADYNGAVKSLGAWGGDFVLVTARLQKPQFVNKMRKKGFDIIYTFDELILQH